MSLEETISRAIAEAWWDTCETPKAWTQMSEAQREVFRICGRRAVEAAREFKAAQAQGRAA